MCDLRSKEFKTLTFPFVMPKHKGFCHVGSDYYMAGGNMQGFSINNFRRIDAMGAYQELRSMPNSKGAFSLAWWAKGNSLLTVGGLEYNNFKSKRHYETT